MNSRLRRLLLSFAFVALPALAQAHPGHDGHDFAWDFSGSPAHVIASVAYGVALIGAGVVTVQLIARGRRSARSKQDR